MPLLSNLTAIDNIALIARFHTRQKDSQIYESIKHLMALLEISDSSELKPSFLDELTRFKVKLLRAVMMPDAAVIIDRPFFMIRNMADIQPVKKMLSLLDTYFEQCIISDYDWHRGRYGDMIE